MFVVPFIEPVRTVLIHVAPGMPPDYWWVTGGVLAILALAATIDAFTEIVPEKLIFLGLLAVTGTQGLFASWGVAGLHLRQAVEAGLLIWGINFTWYCKFRHDALGMGDAKWTMLAVACFGVMPAVYAWGLGAILATLFISVAHFVRYKIAQVTFAPFLFVGLALGLYWVRFVNA